MNIKSVYKEIKFTDIKDKKPTIVFGEENFQEVKFGIDKAEMNRKVANKIEDENLNINLESLQNELETISKAMEKMI